MSFRNLYIALAPNGCGKGLYLALSLLIGVTTIGGKQAMAKDTYDILLEVQEIQAGKEREVLIDEVLDNIGAMHDGPQKYIWYSTAAQELVSVLPYQDIFEIILIIEDTSHYSEALRRTAAAYAQAGLQSQGLAFLNLASERTMKSFDEVQRVDVGIDIAKAYAALCAKTEFIAFTNELLTIILKAGNNTWRVERLIALAEQANIVVANELAIAAGVMATRELAEHPDKMFANVSAEDVGKPMILAGDREKVFALVDVHSGPKFSDDTLEGLSFFTLEMFNEPDYALVEKFMLAAKSNKTKLKILSTWLNMSVKTRDQEDRIVTHLNTLIPTLEQGDNLCAGHMLLVGIYKYVNDDKAAYHLKEALKQEPFLENSDELKCRNSINLYKGLMPKV